MRKLLTEENRARLDALRAEFTEAETRGDADGMARLLNTPTFTELELLDCFDEAASHEMPKSISAPYALAVANCVRREMFRMSAIQSVRRLALEKRFAALEERMKGGA